MVYRTFACTTGIRISAVCLRLASAGGAVGLIGFGKADPCVVTDFTVLTEVGCGTARGAARLVIRVTGTVLARVRATAKGSVLVTASGPIGLVGFAPTATGAIALFRVYA